MNHIVGYCDILVADLRGLDKLDLVSSVNLILAKADKLRRLVQTFFDPARLNLERYPVEDIRNALYDPLMRIIADSRHLIEQAKLQAGQFVPDMEQLLAIANQMHDLLEGELINLQFKSLPAEADADAPPAEEGDARPAELSADPAESAPGLVAQILVVDDHPGFHHVIDRYLRSLGHYVECVSSGQAAFDYLARAKADLVIMDLLMPDMSGLMALERMKRTPSLKGIPVIVMSALESPSGIAQCIKAGAEDFLPKDFDPIILQARLNACLEKKRLQEQQGIFLQALVSSQRQLHAELSDAADYIVSLLPKPLEKPVRAAVALLPSAQLGGDFCAFFPIDADHLALFLLDVSGHGVKSALLAVSLSNIIRAQGLPDTDFRSAGAVLSALNRHYQAGENQTSFFSIWYGVLTVSTGALDYACGGSPPACLVRAERPLEVETLDCRDLVLGAVEDHVFRSQAARLRRGDRLILYSDGLYEIGGGGGAILGLEKFQSLLGGKNGSPRENIQAVVKAVLDATSCKAFEDDVSLLELRY